MENPQMLLALGFMIVSAVCLIHAGSKRLLRHIQLGKRSEETLKTTDAAAFPIHGSMALFSLYVLLRFIPKSYINALLSFYLGLGSILALNSTARHAIGKRTALTGLFSLAIGGLYFYYKHWALTNVLAFGICITAIAEVRIQSFTTSSVLLIGLFLYDIFWVFGTDVMLSVATGIDGPIKILFPQTFFGDHAKLSLLGLGDMVIPGFFISQTLVFSTLHAKKGLLYYRVAMVAYFCSLVNTMAVMVIFKHGQPALLYIVPWLLISVLVAAAVNGDLKKLFSFDMDAVAQDVIAETKKNATKTKNEEEEDIVIDSFTGLIVLVVRDFFGLEPDELVDGEPPAAGTVDSTKKVVAVKPVGSPSPNRKDSGKKVETSLVGSTAKKNGKKTQ